MPVTIPSAVLREMSEAERTRVLNAAFDTSPEALATYVTVLEARLRVFEQRYELPSSALPDALASGRLHETAEISTWIFWAHLWGQLVRQTRP